MGIEARPTLPHWSYFIALDADLVRLSRYVEFHPQNFDCFSLEIARVLLASAAEVDVVGKLLCKKIDRGSKAENILQYRDTIRPAHPRIATFEVRLPRFGLTLHPWDEWRHGRSTPSWWSDYNKVKHQRDQHFARANLKNALNAVAGLFVMVLHLYGEEARRGALVPPPQVLDVPGSLVSAGGGSYGYVGD